MKSILLLVLTLLSCTPTGEVQKSDDYPQVCIDGHAFYRMPSYGFSFTLTGRLNDDGTPVKCGAKR